MQTPQLNLALHGFSPQQKASIQAWLQQHNHEAEFNAIRWQLSEARVADVLLQALSTPTEGIEGGVLRRVFWPSVQTQQEESSEQAYQRFQDTLLALHVPMQPTAVRYLLAHQWVERYEFNDVRKSLWHVHTADTLLAVVDFERKLVAIRPEVHFLEIADAHWSVRSQLAAAPTHFMSMPIERLMWDFAQRSDQSYLPPAYAVQDIRLRRYPRLPIQLLSETELAVLALLRQQPCTLAQLSQQLNQPSEQLEPMLGALYFSGALSTRPLKVWNRLLQSLRGTFAGRLVSASATADGSMPSQPSSLILGSTQSLVR